MDFECAICYEYLCKNNHQEKLLKCGHDRMFHQDCLNDWFTHDKCCPYCRAPVINKQQGELWADYVYLTDDERKKLAKIEHEYLIDQPIKLNFNHPIKELIWVIQHEQNINNH